MLVSSDSSVILQFECAECGADLQVVHKYPGFIKVDACPKCRENIDSLEIDKEQLQEDKDRLEEDKYELEAEIDKLKERIKALESERDA